MNKKISPEDLSNWKEIAEDRETPTILVCRHCGEGIQFWHCADSGCCWCAECGANTKA